MGCKRNAVPPAVRALLSLLVLAAAPAHALLAQRAPAASRPYYPGPADAWERRSPQQVGMDAARLQEAINFAVASESKSPRNLELAHYQTFGREPFGQAVGPFRERGAPAGVVLRRGYLVAEWGDTARVDMTFSVTKSFLSTVVGLAYDRKMIRSLQDRVRDYMPPVLSLAPNRGRGRAESLGEPQLLEPFETEHNRKITWEHLLRQTSDWEGTLWGKPEWADRPSNNPAEWRTRARSEPGAAYEYNDVRVNALALAALGVWRRPLPQVLREHVMDRIDASTTWRWYGYETSWVELDGEAVQSVSGGGHWGGGMFISARDMARFGLLTLRRGRWKDDRILSEEWLRQATTPTSVQPTYGFMNFFLNTERKYLPSAPAAAFAHVGNGTNVIYVDPEHDLVVVARWIENGAVDGFIGRVLASVGGPAAEGKGGAGR
ncbi:MAG TPA: serine hydrolase [Pyrinomonadaceae bacterium]|jgi:CubicO group peptidase (beta-lactamase class C family)